MSDAQTKTSETAAADPAQRAQPKKRSQRGTRRGKGGSTRKKAAKAPRSADNPVVRESLAIILGCAGVLTVLALVSFDPADASFNASRAAEVHNWIGPAGAYWADLLLQLLGVGAYAFGAGMLLAAWRSLVRKRVLPGLRETTGLALLVISSGTLAHIATLGSDGAYPAGGLGGALLGSLLLQQFAVAGAYILAVAWVLVALVITADGILSGLGWRGMTVMGELVNQAHALAVYVKTRWQARQRQQRAEPVDPEAGAQWTFGDPELAAQRQRAREQRLEAAKQKAQAAAAQDLERQQAASKRRCVREPSEPDVHLDDTVDLPSEEEFELGALDAVAPADATSAAANSDVPEPTGELDEPSRDVPIRAAMPDGVRDEAVQATPAVAATSAPSNPAKLQPAADAARARASEEGAEASPTPPTEASPVPSTEASPTLPTEAAPGPSTEASPAPSTEASPTPSTEASPAPPKSDAAAAQSAVKAQSKGTAETSASEPQILDVRPEVDLEAMERATKDNSRAPAEIALPEVSLLDFEPGDREPIDPQKLRDNALKLTKTLKDYGIDGQIREIRTGPVVTMYEFVPAPGIKLSKIVGLSDDLAMSMEAMRVRIVAPIPGKGAVGIEIPNEDRETVYFKEIITNDKFLKSKSKLTMALGKDIEGIPYVADLAKMPHLLVAGATGAGKSVSVNSMIMSILFNATPDEVRLLMVDPKMLELSVYDGIPHLLLPVVTDPKKATMALRWAVEEMERRYKAMSELGVRNLNSYNRKIKEAEDKGEKFTLPPAKEGEEERVYERLPYLVVIVDELADLMMVASRDVEACIMRLAQMARAAGIHLILATQRPSVDVITGVIKANFPTRIAFQVASRHDSRTIIDANGAENLLGKGDMLYVANGAAGLSRVHGAFVSDDEIERTVAFLRQQGEPEYDESILQPRDDAESDSEADDSKDEMYDRAIAIVTETQQASISMVQRRLRIGYNRAARLVEQMEADGIVGPAEGSKPRQVLAPPPPPAA